MKIYKVKIEVDAEVEAFDENDAVDYVNDIFGADDEVKSVKVIQVKEKQREKYEKVIGNARDSRRNQGHAR